MQSRDPRSKHNETGAAMLYVAFFLMASLWFASLAIDVGKLTTTKTELQKAADAAALAGASSVNPDGGTIVQDSARVRAAFASAANSALREGQEAVTIDPMGDVSFPTPNQVRVQVHRETATGNPMTTLFAQTLGITSLDVTADATAEVAALTEVCEGLLPFAPVQDASGFSKECGSEYTLHTDPSASNGGNFQLLSFPECDQGPCAGAGSTGAEMVRCLLANGYGCCIGIGDQFSDTKPGASVGPVRQGLQERWDADTDQAEHCYQEYTGTGERVLHVPIVETFQVNGRTNVTITGFAAFFMLRRPSGGANNMQITGQFIDDLAPGVAGPPPPPGPALYGVHLVE